MPSTALASSFVGYLYVPAMVPAMDASDLGIVVMLASQSQRARGTFQKIHGTIEKKSVTSHETFSNT